MKTGSWVPWGSEGPLVRGLVSGNPAVPQPGPPPAGARVTREAGGGFKARIGRWPLSLDLRLTSQALFLSGIFRRRRIELSALSGVEERPLGLVFSAGGESFLFALPDPEIRAWMRGLILRNLVSPKGV